MINRMIRVNSCLLLFFLPLQAGNVTVSYLSHEHVYLDGGTADGIVVGTILSVIRNQTIIARLEVIYVAEHSASCKIVQQTGDIKPSDKVEIPDSETTRDTTVAPEKIDAISKAPILTASPEKETRVKPDISGYLTVQWYRFHDQSKNNNHFDQPAMRFKFKARNFWHQSFSLEIRTRSRYYDRHGRTGSDMASTEWRHQLYTAALTYQNPATGIGLSAGRILSGYMSGAGYIDGMQLSYMINPSWKAGLFAGYQPDWKTSSFQKNRSKYGTFISYQAEESAPWRAQVSLSAVGEYHDTVISREFLYLQGSLNVPGNWNIYHSMEIDINRAWRQERTGNKVALSSLYLSAFKQISDGISGQLTYDNRQNYYTYDYYSLSDSLFDDAFRHGMRFYLNFKFHQNFRLALNSGVRKREDNSQTTYSHGIRATVPRLFINRLSLTGQGSFFTNLYSKGVTSNINLAKRMKNGHEIAISFGSQHYQLLINRDRYRNNWLRLQSYLALPYRLNLYTYYEYDFGDDIKGQNIFAEMGYYF